MILVNSVERNRYVCTGKTDAVIVQPATAVGLEDGEKCR